MSQNRRSWKKVSSRRAKLWKSVNGSYQPVPSPLKTMLIGVVLVLVILVPLFGYYQNNVAPYQNGLGLCPSGHVPVNGSCGNGDPWSTLWNGQVSGSTGAPLSGAATVTPLSDGPTTATAIGPVKTGDFIMVHTFCASGSGGAGTPTDNLGNSYSSIVSVVRGVIWYAISKSDGSGGGQTVAVSDTFTTCNVASNPAGSFSVEILKNVNVIGPSATCCGGGTSSPDVLTITTLYQHSIVYETVDTYNTCGITNNSGQITVNNLPCFSSVDAGRVVNSGGQGNPPDIQPGSHSFSMSGGSSIGHMVVEVGNNFAGPACSTYYLCQNANLVSGDITTAANSTFPGIAMSQSRVDHSTGVGNVL
jgi:hypothetical protein